jgi:hypothetical protein
LQKFFEKSLNMIAQKSKLLKQLDEPNHHYHYGDSNQFAPNTPTGSFF